MDGKYCEAKDQQTWFVSNIQLLLHQQVKPGAFPLNETPSSVTIHLYCSQELWEPPTDWRPNANRSVSKGLRGPQKHPHPTETWETPHSHVEVQNLGVR